VGQKNRPSHATQFDADLMQAADTIHSAAAHIEANIAALDAAPPAGVQAATSTLANRIAELIDQHGTLRATARVLDCDPGYLSRLQSGEKDDPGEALLRRMKLRRVVTYERTDVLQPGQVMFIDPDNKSFVMDVAAAPPVAPAPAREGWQGGETMTGDLSHAPKLADELDRYAKDWCVGRGMQSQQRETLMASARMIRALSAAAPADLTLDRALQLADVHAEESREDGRRVFDRGGIKAFADDCIRIAVAPAEPPAVEADAINASAAKDAKRYRWLRAGRYSFDIARSILNDTPHGIDAAIDSAMSAAVEAAPMVKE
jgi:hypothetical protein